MEMCFGPEFEGKHFDRKAATVPGNIHNQLATIVKMWVEGELNHVMPGGESPLQVCQSSDRPLYFIFYWQISQVEARARRAFFQIANLCDATNNRIPGFEGKDDSVENYLIVCHGRLIKILLCSLLDIGLENMEKFQQNNTAVNVIEYDPSSKDFTVALLNCTSHLEEPPNNWRDSKKKVEKFCLRRDGDGDVLHIEDIEIKRPERLGTRFCLYFFIFDFLSFLFHFLLLFRYSGWFFQYTAVYNPFDDVIFYIYPPTP